MNLESGALDCSAILTVEERAVLKNAIFITGPTLARYIDLLLENVFEISPPAGS